MCFKGRTRPTIVNMPKIEVFICLCKIVRYSKTITVKRQTHVNSDAPNSCIQDCIHGSISIKEIKSTIFFLEVWNRPEAYYNRLNTIY